MRKYKNVLTVIIVALMFVVLVAIPFTVAIVNDALAARTLKEIKNIELPENSKILSEYAVAGKVSGNGNGMQYFGAILIESEQDLTSLQEYYHNVGSEYFISVKGQKSDAIDVLNGNQHYFDGVDDCDFENCYIVYGYGKGGNWFLDLDLRGH
ncbi:MAG: hypothetical protein J6S13_02635 [Clostridia bacterium]|nr:hypothetical protein [Clostridia bacterium]